MNVQDQLLVKDFGKQFKQRVKRSFTHFSTVLEPTHVWLRGSISDWFAGFALIDDELIRHQLIETCFQRKRYIGRIEDFNYRFLISALDYLFTGRQAILEFREDINYRYLTIIYVEQLRGYFHGRQRRSLTRLYDKLKDLKTQKEQDECQEGFIDAMFEDSEPQQLRKQKTSVGNQSFADEGDGGFSFTKKEMQEKDEMIAALNGRIKQREQNLIEITAGYLKDIQLLREQLFRKEYSNVQESYDVSYINVSEIMDPRYRELVNVHLDDLKVQFEKRTQDLYRTIDNQKTEIRNLKTQIQSLHNLTKTMDTPFDMIHKAIRLEPSPYKIWKILQDIKGNFYFREVFETQRAIYGINYREVNQLMMTSKAYEREFVLYKQQVQDQQFVFYEKALKEVEAARQSVREKDTEIMELKNGIQIQRQDFFDEAVRTMDEQLQGQIEIFKDQYEADRRKMQKEVQMIEVIKLKQVFSLWAMTNRVILVSQTRIVKFTSRPDMDLVQIKNEVKSLFIDEKIYTDVTRDMQNQIQVLKQQLRLVHDQNKRLTYKNVELLQQQKQFGESFEAMQSKVGEMQQRMSVLEIMKRQCESSKEIIESCCSQIIGLIEPKMAHLRVEELRLFDKQSDLAQDFLERIKALDSSQIRSIKELKEQSVKNGLSYVPNPAITIKEAFIQTQFKLNVITQTEIQDVTLPLGRHISPQYSPRSSSSDPIEEQPEESVVMTQPFEVPNMIEDSETEFESLGKQYRNARTQANTYQDEQTHWHHREKELNDEIRKHNRTIERLKSKIKTLKTQALRTQQKPAAFNKARGSILNMELDMDGNQKRIHSRQSISEEGLRRASMNVSTRLVERDKQSSHMKVDISIDNTNSRGQSKQEQRYVLIPISNRELIQGLNMKPINEFTNQVIEPQKRNNVALTSPSVMNRTNRILDKYLILRQNRKHQQVYERLFNDSAKKAERIKELKHNLQVLEKSHWDDVLHIFSTYQLRDPELRDTELLDQERTFHSQTKDYSAVPAYKASTPYRTKSNQQYYEKVRRKDVSLYDGVGDIYQNWFGKKHIQMGKMLQTFDHVQAKRDVSLNSTLSPSNRPARSFTTRGHKLHQIQTESKANSQPKTGILNSTNDNFQFAGTYGSLLPPTISTIVREQQTKRAVFKIRQ